MNKITIWVHRLENNAWVLHFTGTITFFRGNKLFMVNKSQDFVVDLSTSKFVKYNEHTIIMDDKYTLSFDDSNVVSELCGFIFGNGSNIFSRLKRITDVLDNGEISKAIQMGKKDTIIEAMCLGHFDIFDELNKFCKQIYEIFGNHSESSINRQVVVDETDSVPACSTTADHLGLSTSRESLLRPSEYTCAVKDDTKIYAPSNAVNNKMDGLLGAEKRMLKCVHNDSADVEIEDETNTKRVGESNEDVNEIHEKISKSFVLNYATKEAYDSYCIYLETISKNKLALARPNTAMSELELITYLRDCYKVSYKIESSVLQSINNLELYYFEAFYYCSCLVSPFNPNIERMLSPETEEDWVWLTEVLEMVHCTLNAETKDGFYLKLRFPDIYSSIAQQCFLMKLLELDDFRMREFVVSASLYKLLVLRHWDCEGRLFLAKLLKYFLCIGSNFVFAKIRGYLDDAVDYLLNCGGIVEAVVRSTESSNSIAKEYLESKS